MIKLIVICVLLLAFHFAVKWLEARQTASSKGLVPPGLHTFIADSPAQTLVTVLGSVSAFLLVDELGWMNPGMAGACGYMGSSIADNVVKQYEKMVGQP